MSTELALDESASSHRVPFDFISRMEAGSRLLEPDRLPERLAVLDQIDAILGTEEAPVFRSDSMSTIRLRALQLRLEAANRAIYEHVRCEIVREGYARMLYQWLLSSAPDDLRTAPASGLSFDLRDEMVCGVLELREPDPAEIALCSEMQPYQPTPARHTLDLITASKLAKQDVLVDLGSGLGHVPLLVSILTGIRTEGIELQSSYVATARACAQNLHIEQAQFIAADVRIADLSNGTVFYLYSPFTGSILADVLSKLRNESSKRPIKVCSLGPCTRILKQQVWLRATRTPDPGRIAVFASV